MLTLVLIVCLGVRLALAPIMMNDSDRKDYVSDAHKTVRYGVAHYYDPSPDYQGYKGVPSPYPPLQIYFYALAGHVYQKLFDSRFSEVEHWRDLPFDSVALNYLIKAPIFLFELLLTAAIFFWLRGRTGDWRALVCAALYGLNPAVLFDGALWEQPDALHSAFLSAAVILLISRKPVGCLVMLALALASKPQPAVFVPVVLLLVALRSPLRQTAAAIAAACATGVVVFLPYLVNSGQAITQMLQAMSRANPVVSAQAHNFWWLIVAPQGLNPLEIRDSTVTFMGISYFTVSMLILLIFCVAVGVRLIKTRAGHLTPEPFAYIGLLFFVFGVRAHENHAIQVLPLLALTGLVLWHQRAIFTAMSLSILANMMLHSPEIIGEEPSRLVGWIRIMNAAVCVAAFAYWSYKMFHPRATHLSQSGPERNESASSCPSEGSSVF